MSLSNGQGDRRSVFYDDMHDIVSRFIPGDIFGGRYRPSDNIMDDVLALSQEANTNETEGHRIAQTFFTMGSGAPLWYVGDSPKRLLDDFDPNRDTGCTSLLPEGKTPADGMVKRLGYAPRVYARTKGNSYASATIDVDIDVPLFCPVDEYRENHTQDDLSWFISQSVIGEADDNWEDSVKIALDDLIESGQIKNTPYWALKNAFNFFAQNFDMDFLPVVEVDPISLKSHFTLYTAYMRMSVHQEMTRIISETFFKGMYDKALTEENRALALTRVGSMSKSDGMNGKFLYRRFLWSFSEHYRVATFLLLTRAGFEFPKASEKKLSAIRSLAMENGVEVNRDREHQYKAGRPKERLCDMVTTALDAYIFNVYAVTRGTKRLWLTMKELGDNLFRPTRFGMEYTAKLNPSWIYGHKTTSVFAKSGKTHESIMLGEWRFWNMDLINVVVRKPAKLDSGPLSAGHLIDYNEENEPRPTRRRSSAPKHTESEVVDGSIDDLYDNDEDERRRRRRRKSAHKDNTSKETTAKSTDCADDDEKRPTHTPTGNRSDHSGKRHVSFKMSDAEFEALYNEIIEKEKQAERDKNNVDLGPTDAESEAAKPSMSKGLSPDAVKDEQDWQSDPVYENPLKKLRRQFEAEKAAEDARKADPHYQKLEAERRAIQEQRDRDKQEYKRRIARIISINDQEEKYGKLAWKRTLKEKARTNKKGHLIGVEALYLMMSRGQNCRFGGLFGDPARMAGLMTFVYTISSDKGGVTFDDNPHVLKSELNNKQWSAAVESVASTISNMGCEIYSRSATKLARIVVDTALYGMGQAVHELAMDITTNSNLSREWMAHFERGLRDMEHSIVSDQFANPYSVRSRHRKIRNNEGKSLDVITNVYMKGKRGALTPMEFVELTGAVLNFDTENLHKLR